MESMFEVVDGHADGVSEAAYVAFAERLNGLCIAKPKAGETRPAQDRSQLRHRWPEAKKPEQFLSGAIKAIQGALDAPRRRSLRRRRKRRRGAGSGWRGWCLGPGLLARP